MEPNRENTNEQPRQNPTEASNGFLRKVTDRLLTDRPGTLRFFVDAVAFGSFGILAVENAMQGNYTSAAVEGIIAGVFAMSPVRHINRLRRPEGSEDDKKA